MSWHVTVNEMQMVEGLPPEVLAHVALDNPSYKLDVQAAFDAARKLGFRSATLSGGRTPSPYGGPETVVIAITAFSDDRVAHAVERPVADTMWDYPIPDEDHGDVFYESMARTIMSGPDKDVTDG